MVSDLSRTDRYCNDLKEEILYVPPLNSLTGVQKLICL